MLTEYQVQKLNEEIISTRSLFIAILIIVIIFILLTFGFVYYPVYLMKSKVADITVQSKTALDSLKTNVATGEETLQAANAGTAEVSSANAAIQSLIDQLCERSPFINDTFCKERA